MTEQGPGVRGWGGVLRDGVEGFDGPWWKARLRGTGEPWEVCEQERGRVNTECREVPLESPGGWREARRRSMWGSWGRGEGLSGAQAIEMEKTVKGGKG